MPRSEVAHKPLRVLFVEDSSDDVELALLALRAAGFSPTYEMVETAADLAAALDKGGWDVIIADYAMPEFTGLDALRIVQRHDRDVPFVLVSGTVGEEVAVEAMRAGAQDYVLKDKLVRLPLAVERELREAAVRRDKQRFERMQAFVAKVSAALVESLDYDTTLRRFAELVVAELANWCVIELFDRSGAFERVVMTHRDPAQRDVAAELERAFIAEPASPRTELMARLRPESSLALSLEARGQSLGALTLISTDPESSFGDSETELGRELARRLAMAVDNARLYRDAQQAIELRDEFIAIASHELKTPTFAVSLQLEGLHDIVRKLQPSRTDPRLETRLARATVTMGRVSRLVESLLDVSRLSVGKLELERSPMDLVAMVQNLVDGLAEQAENARSSITVLGPQPVSGRWDRLRLEQVISILLANALKYGAGKPIQVRLGRRAETAFVEVIDYGMGVRPEDRERIFRRFERAVPLRHYGGLGLGLYIARQIVEAHGGTLRAQASMPERQSQPESEGRGATFIIELPVDANLRERGGVQGGSPG